MCCICAWYLRLVLYMYVAAAGAFDLDSAVMETLNGFKRAGARILITYFTPRVLELLAKHKA